MDTLFEDVMNLVQNAVILGGGLWLLWGVIVLAGGIKDSNGPGIQAGVWQIIGGGLILAAAVLFANIR